MTDPEILRLNRPCRCRPPRAAVAFLLAAVLLLSAIVSSPCNAADPAAQGEAAPSQGLAEIMPKARELMGKKARLETRIAQLTSLLDAEATLAGLRQRYTASVEALQSLEAAGDYSPEDLNRMEVRIRQDSSGVDVVAADLTGRIEEIESERKQWSELGTLWKDWEDVVPTQEAGPAVRAAFAEAHAAVTHVMTLLTRAAPKIVQAQREAVGLQAQFQELSAKVGDLGEALKEGLFGLSSPPLFTAQFRQQLAASLRRTLADFPGQAAGLRPHVSPNWGWLVLLHVCLAAGLAFALRWSRVGGAVGEKWGALLERPFAAGTLAGAMMPLAFYVPILKLPPAVAFLVPLAGGVAAVRLSSRMIASRALQRALLVTVGVFVVERLLGTAGLPTPVLRVYNVLVGAVGAPLCLRWAVVWQKSGEPRRIVVACQAAGALLAVACLAQLTGFSSLGFRLAGGLVWSTFLLPLGWMFSLLLRGSAELLLERLVLNRWGSIRARRAEILGTLGVISDGATLCLFFSFFLVIWGILDTPAEAVRFLLGLGFTWGEQRFTVGLALTALALLYLSTAVSRVVQAVLEGQVYPQRKIEPGAGISINRLIHYAFVLAGFLLALSALGIGVGKLTVVAGALGVGIGFGLQTIVNNFVSGLILLSERPIKVGDLLQLDTEWGKVTQLGLRATTIQTFDRSEIIVPNSELVAGRVVNWTHSDRVARLLVPVGVAYGSDVALVMRILEEVAAAHLKVASDPKPEAVFLRFGESSLDFRLQAHVWDVEDRLKVQSDLLTELDRRFREAGIEIPFPQRVVHLSKEAGAPAEAGPEQPAAAPDAQSPGAAGGPPAAD